MKRWLQNIACIIIFYPSTAHALCLGMGLQGVPATATFQGATTEYQVYDPAQYLQTVNFQVGGGASIATCNYFVTLSPGNSGNPSQRKLVLGGSSLNYNVYTDLSLSNILKDLSTASASNVITGSFPVALGTGQTNNQSLYWTITPSQVVAANATRYQDTSLTLSLYTGLLLGVYVLADSKTITFRAQAESSVDLSLVSTGGAFSTSSTTQTVNFGTLSNGETMSYDTIIRSNDGYLVTMKSQNSEVMKQASPSVTTTVPYTMTFGGSLVNLSSGATTTVISHSGTTTPATGDRYATKFTIGTLTGGETAGTYQDVITVTVSAD